jgi:cell division protein FtsW
MRDFDRYDTAADGARVRELDWLMLAVVALCCLGLTMAVSVQGSDRDHSTLLAMKAQGAKLVAGLVAFLAGAVAPLELLRRHARVLFLLGTALLLATLIVRADWNGANRWISIGGTSVQPVEFARLATILLTAASIAAAGTSVGELRRGFVAVVGPAVAVAGILALQPDFGNALLMLALVSATALVAGVRLRWFVLVGVPLLPLAAAAVLSKGYAVGRIAAFLSDEPPYQVRQSITAISSGGLTGQGIGNGWMKLGFVPEARNDFVFAIVGEELGLLGTLIVLGLYVLIGYVGYRLVLGVRDPFRRYVIFGCTMAICMQALINLLVTTGMAPAKGIDLPLVSSGGTNLVASLCAIGLIGNAARADFVARPGAA